MKRKKVELVARPDVSEASDEIPEEADVTVVAGEQDSTELSLLSSGAVGTCSGLLDACFSGAWSWTTIGMAALAMTLDAKMAVVNEFLSQTQYFYVSYF